MTSSKFKLIGLFSIVAMLASLMAIGSLVARPSDSPSSTVEAVPSLKGGTNIVDTRWFSVKAGSDVVVIEVADADKDIANKHPQLVENPAG